MDSNDLNGVEALVEEGDTPVERTIKMFDPRNPGRPSLKLRYNVCVCGQLCSGKRTGHANTTPVRSMLYKKEICQYLGE